MEKEYEFLNDLLFNVFISKYCLPKKKKEMQSICHR